MTRRALSFAVRAAAVLAAPLLAAACSSAQNRMQRGIEPSIERVVRTESYLRTVAGVSSQASRQSRVDGYVYVSDLAPQLRYLAEVGDTARYVTLRASVLARLTRRGTAGLVLARRYRDGEAFERASPYGYLWTIKALRDGWGLLGDTASAQALAQLVPLAPEDAQNRTPMSRLFMDCAEAEDVVASDAARARGVLARSRTLIGSAAFVKEQWELGATAEAGEADLLSCLTRVALELGEPDATVRHLDRLLDRMQILVGRSGRPAVGTAADILLTLHRVREAGPRYYHPHPERAR